MNTKEIPSTVKQVMEYLKIDLDEVIYKKSFFDDTESWRAESIYSGGDFKLKSDDSVSVTTAVFDENENKVITVRNFKVVDNNVQEIKIAVSEFNDDNFLIQSIKANVSDKLKGLANSYDQYVEARERDYRYGKEMNARILDSMTELGVFNFTIKNYTPMFSSTSDDWKLI